MTTKLAIVEGPASIRDGDAYRNEGPRCTHDEDVSRPNATRPRTACRTVVMPLTTRAAKAAHDM